MLFVDCATKSVYHKQLSAKVNVVDRLILFIFFIEIIFKAKLNQTLGSRRLFKLTLKIFKEKFLKLTSINI